MADLEGLDKGEVKQAGVVDADAGGRLREAEPLQRLPDGDRPERGVGEQVERPGEPDTVEPHSGHALGDGVQGLLAQPLGHCRLEVGRPVHARQLHPPSLTVDDPSRARRKGEGDGCGRCSGGEEEEEKESGGSHGDCGAGDRHFARVLGSSHRGRDWVEATSQVDCKEWMT